MNYIVNKLMMKRLLILAILILLKGNILLAQLQAFPDSIEFKDVFHRLVNINLINNGAAPVTIDSIYYASNLNYQTNFYLTRFNKTSNNSVIINSGDTLKMDCILAGYFEVAPGDSVDTMFLSASNKIIVPIKIKIKFYKEYYTGIVNGIVKDGTTPLDSTNIYFFYNGSFLFKKVVTDNNGYYSAVLPEGFYTVAADKLNYRVIFYNQQSSPFDAARLHLYHNEIAAINFNLQPITNSGFTIGGYIEDKLASSTVNSGYVIVRPGRHTPSKIKSGSAENDYAGIINSDGSFRINNISSGTYLLQSFSGYYSPTYFTSRSNNAEFWQHADTIIINNNISGLSIGMARDSSFGGGIIDGTIKSSSPNFDFSNIMVYAFSVFAADTVIYNYGIADSLGHFEIDRLPYGTYNLVAQKLNYPDVAYASNVIINPSNETVSGINIQFSVDNIINRGILPYEPALFQNYPNPFNPTTIINYSITQNEFVKLKIYDLLGRLVATLVDEEMPKGNHSVKFIASGLPSGVYLYRLQAGSFARTKKLILLK